MLRTQDYVAIAAEYFQALQRQAEGLLGLVLRGPREDIVPGTSDIDMRLLCGEGVDWVALDQAVALVHRQFLSRGPQYRPILEHPPGACHLLGECLDARLYLPEMRCWDLVCGDEASWRALCEHLERLPWSVRDEAHWLGVLRAAIAHLEEEQELSGLPRHRGPAALLLHWFLPALQAALSLSRAKPIRGRREALYLALEELPPSWALEEAKAAFEDPTRLDGPADEAELRALKQDCLRVLHSLWPEGGRATRCAESGEAQELLALYQAVRFFRVRRSHYAVFLSQPQDEESDYLIRNELSTLKDLFLARPLSAYAAWRWGSLSEQPGSVLRRLGEEDFATAQLEAARRLLELACDDMGAEQARAALAEAAQLWEPFRELLEDLFSFCWGAGRG